MATVVPLAAFLAAEAYFSLAPLLGRVPAPLFWVIALTTLAGAGSGLFLTTSLALRRRAEVRGGRAISWLLAAGAASLLCTWRFLGLTLPWL